METSRPAPVFVLMLDGVGDRPWPVLDKRSPLDAARTPNLDAIAMASATGILHSLGRGRAPGTELAHFVLLGYPPAWYPGRGVFEALGAGLTVDSAQVVLHAIFVTVRREADSSLTILERYPRRSESEIARIAGLLGEFEHDGIRITLTHTGREEAIVIVTGTTPSTRPSTQVTDTDPHNNGWLVGTVRPLFDAEDTHAATLTADALRAFLAHAYRTLLDDAGLPDAPGTESPFLLLKWTSRARSLPSFADHTGMRGRIVSSTRLFEGFSRALGLEHTLLPSLSELAEDTAVRLAAGAKALADTTADFVLVHSKAPDVAGHTKDPIAKRDALVAIDTGAEGLVNRVAGGVTLPEDTIVVVTGDHGTPAGTSLIHSGDPVPLAIMSRAMATDSVSSFDERACSGGSLGHVNGTELMPMLLNARGTVRYEGGRLATHTGLYWPRDYEPFRVD